MKKMILTAALLAAAPMGFAQQPAAQAPAAKPQAQQLTPAQQAQVKQQDEKLTAAANQVIQLTDQGKSGEVWDGASTVAKSAVTRDAFIKQVTDDRKRLGAVTARKAVGVNRAQYRDGGKVPAGNYVTVVYATRFASQPQDIREMVSFHLDQDQTWRLAGYTIR